MWRTLKVEKHRKHIPLMIKSHQHKPLFSSGKSSWNSQHEKHLETKIALGTDDGDSKLMILTQTVCYTQNKDCPDSRSSSNFNLQCKELPHVFDCDNILKQL